MNVENCTFGCGAVPGWFDTTCLGVPAGMPFRIVFRNLVPDQPRNISIFTVRHPCSSSQVGGSVGASSCDGAHRVFLGRFVAGPRTVIYRVPVLAPGTYYFLSEVLPDDMHGTLIVR